MKTLLIAFFVLTANLLIAQSWYDVSVPTDKKLNDIDFPTSTTGYIVGDSATILKTTDGGQNWAQVPLTGITINPWALSIADVEFVDEQIGFIVFQDNGFGPYKTIDGGNTWIDMANTMSNMCYKNSLYVNSETDFFLGGAGCFQSGQIERFVDPNWNYATVNYETWNPGEFVTDMDFNNGVGIAAMNGHYFLRSTDDGLTWDSIPSGLTGQSFLTCVMFASVDIIYAGFGGVNGTGYSSLISIDAGLTWNYDPSPISFFNPLFFSLAKSNSGKVYVGGKVGWGDQGVIFETANGSSWLAETVDQPINGIASYNADVTFAVGDSGYVVVNTDLASLGLNFEDYLYPINVYPNPTSDFITIENEFNKKVVYNLVDLNGQVVMADIVAANGTTIDISRLETGIYYLKPNEKQFNTIHKIVKL